MKQQQKNKFYKLPHFQKQDKEGVKINIEEEKEEISLMIQKEQIEDISLRINKTGLL